MRRYLYLSTAVAGVIMTAGAGCAWAQSSCLVTENCITLGYTETSCHNGNMLRCPFGEFYACLGSSVDCSSLGYDKTCTGAGEVGSGPSCNGKYASCSCDASYQYTCSGTGYSGGSGTACGGKYTACTCASGYAWKNGACNQVVAVPCIIGALYYSDGTCYNQKVDSKTLLGVVIMEKTSSANGWIITVNPVQTGIAWGGYDTEIPRLTNIRSETNLTDIQASCTNTDIITSYGNSSTYPAAWTAKNYSPSGTPSGKSWCLPSGGLLNSALNNLTNLTLINAGIATAGGTTIGNVRLNPAAGSNIERVWSSSEYSSQMAWFFHAFLDGRFSMDKEYKDNNYFESVRPVMAF